MKRLVIKILAVVPLVIVLLGIAAPSVCAQPGRFENLGKIPRLGEIMELTSLNQSHLAVWYSNVPKIQLTDSGDLLVIYEMRDREPVEVFRIKSSLEDMWQRIIPLNAFNLTGVTIQSSHSFTSNDAALVIALVDGKFSVVFSGLTSEILDLNGDGIPAIFESMWPDGDGPPKTTTIHVWNGKKYRPLMKTSWRNRFAPGVRSSIERASRRMTSKPAGP